MDTPRWSFWGIAVLGFVWNGMGAANFLAQRSAQTLVNYPEPIREMILARPGWATAAFGIAMFAGVLGCLMMLLKRAMSVPILMVSLVGVTITLVQFLMHTLASPGGMPVAPTVLSLVVAGVLLWTAQVARARGWLR